MMRSSRYVVLASVALGVVACTSILGTFTLGPSTGAGDGGPESGSPSNEGGESGPDATNELPDGGDAGSVVTKADASDASLALDAASDGPASEMDAVSSSSDASDGSTSALRRLQCTSASALTRVQVTTGDSLYADLVSIAPAPGGNGMVRVALVNYAPQMGSGNTAVLQAYTVNTNNVQISTSSLPTNSGQVFLLQRYGGLDTGFVAVYEAYNNPSDTIYVARISDSATSWNTPVAVATVPNSLNNVSVSLYSIDASKDSYYLAMSYVSGTTEVLTAGPVSASTAAAALPAIATYTLDPPASDGYQLLSPGIALSKAQPFLFLSPNGANGPPQLGAPALMVDPGGAPSSAQIAPPSTLNYLGLGMANATNGLLANVAILQADLNAIQITYRVGQVAASSLLSLDPMSLPGTTATAADGGTAGFTDFIISNPTVKWEYADLADQLLVMAPPSDTTMNYAGLNFGWWDASGVLRAYAAGADALLSDVPYVHKADATFVSLVGSIAQLWLAYEDAATPPGNNNYPPPASDLWLARINCTPAP